MKGSKPSSLVAAMFIGMVATCSIAHSEGAIVAGHTGRVCVPNTQKEPRGSDFGAFGGMQGRTSEFVQIRVDKSEKRKVSPSEKAAFHGLDTKNAHRLSIYSYDGKHGLASFKFSFGDSDTALCVKRKPTYGTWTIAPENVACRCAQSASAVAPPVPTRNAASPMLPPAPPQPPRDTRPARNPDTAN